jgi:cation:H+ antiporter
VDHLLVNIALFIVGALAVWLGGSRLPAAGEDLAGRLGISTTAVGLFVLSIVTSLPELSVTLAAMLEENAPSLAFGNILGSNNFNITCLVGLEFMSAGVLLHHVDRARFVRTCLVLLALSVIAGLGVLLSRRMPGPALPVLLFSVPVIVVFAADSVTHGIGGRTRKGGRRRQLQGSAGVFWRFVSLSAVVVLGGFLIARGSNEIAAYRFGGGSVLGETFVGTLLVAVSTSMPEVSVAYSAVRRANLEDMALGTILGSNTINLLIFAVGAPLLLLKDPRSAWYYVDASNLVSVIGALLLTLLVLVGITSRSRHGGRLAARTAVALLAPVYLIDLFLVYRMA